MTAIQNRYDFVYLFDVTNGNPNGDPDAGNLPRLDPETNHGLVTDVCLKRKIRNYVADFGQTSGEGLRNEIYMAERAILNDQHMRAWKAIPVEPDKKGEYKKLPRDETKARELTAWMCRNFYEIRTFGAVMSTDVNCGQVRGPVQFAFAHSVEPIVPLEISITRMAATKEDETKGDIRTMGRKHIVPYALYRGHGFVSAKLANDGKRGTGFSDEDLKLLWRALADMFDHDRSAARGEMNARELIVFRHQSSLGSAHAHELFKRVEVWRVVDGGNLSIEEAQQRNLPPARRFEDYRVMVDERDLPAGVTIERRIAAGIRRAA
jgi:CRISPR-associated protein Csd2